MTEYKRLGQRLVVYEVSTQTRHICQPNHSKADISEAMEAATNDLAQKVNTAVKLLERDVQTIKLDAIDHLKDTVEKVAADTVKNLVPVEHHIVITHPNGTQEKSKGRPHFQLEEIIEMVQLRQHTFLVGPAGSGKTSAVVQAAKALDLPYKVLSMGQGSTEDDLIGYLTPDGKYIQPKTCMREMYEFGGVLLLDEIDNSNANVLTTMNALLANGECTFPDAVVQKHPDFVCLAAGNTYGRGANRVYVGRVQLDGATLDRFGIIDWEYDEEAELEWAGFDQKAWVAHVQRVRRRGEELGMRYIISPRASIKGADMLRHGISWERADKRHMIKGMPAEDWKRLCE